MILARESKISIKPCLSLKAAIRHEILFYGNDDFMLTLPLGVFK